MLLQCDSGRPITCSIRGLPSKPCTNSQNHIVHHHTGESKSCRVLFGRRYIDRVYPYDGLGRRILFGGRSAGCGCGKPEDNSGDEAESRVMVRSERPGRRLAEGSPSSDPATDPPLDDRLACWNTQSYSKPDSLARNVSPLVSTRTEFSVGTTADRLSAELPDYFPSTGPKMV